MKTMLILHFLIKRKMKNTRISVFVASAALWLIMMAYGAGVTAQTLEQLARQNFLAGKYAEAKKYFQSAQNCDMKPRQNDLADWIGKCDEKLKTSVVQGALNGVFSVSPTKKVVFSKGNLQYRASTNTWRFAEHQYDIIGEAINAMFCGRRAAAGKTAFDHVISPASSSNN